MAVMMNFYDKIITENLGESPAGFPMRAYDLSCLDRAKTSICLDLAALGLVRLATMKIRLNADRRIVLWS